MTLNPNAPVFVPSSETQDFYYHVTKEKNLPGIIQTGLEPKFGGTSVGMSDLRFRAQAQQAGLSEDFLTGSKNKVHFTGEWDVVERYCQHNLALTKRHFDMAASVDISSRTEEQKYDSIPLNELPAILRCYKKGGKSYLEPDKHEKQGVTTTQVTKPDVICIVVERRGAEGRYFWLPLAYWDSARYRPAYPDRPNLATQYSR
jgi:hypothetical protein